MTVEFARGKSYVVDRGKPKMRAGQGMLAGLDVVIRHFVSAFAQEDRDAGRDDRRFHRAVS